MKHSYEVEMLRISYATATIRVEAETEADARNQAEDIAGNYLYNETSAEYDAGAVTQLPTTK
jgi:hypothetical protein